MTTMIDRRSTLTLGFAALANVCACQVLAATERGSAMPDSIPKLVNRYYAAWQQKDLAGILTCLHPDVVFKSPNATTKGKDAYAAGAQRFLSILDRIDVRNTFYSADGAMVAADFYCIQPIGICPTAERMAFKDGLIVDDELFFDARPFEALSRSKAAAKEKP